MPEKPEVITVVKSLIPEIVHKEITGCNVYWNNIIAYPDVESFKENIIGQNINGIKTRGKFIVMELDDYSLLVHLRMEGKFFFRKKGDAINKHEHVELILDDSISFRFHDVRKFGKMYLIKKEETYKVKPLSELGLEYDDNNLNAHYLIDKFKNKKLPIKTVLRTWALTTVSGPSCSSASVRSFRRSPKPETTVSSSAVTRMSFCRTITRSACISVRICSPGWTAVWNMKRSSPAPCVSRRRRFCATSAALTRAAPGSVRF